MIENTFERTKWQTIIFLKCQRNTFSVCVGIKYWKMFPCRSFGWNYRALKKPDWNLTKHSTSARRLDFVGKPLSLNRGDIRDSMQTIQTSFSTSCGQVVVCTIKWKAHSDKLPRTVSYIIGLLLKIETDYTTSWYFLCITSLWA